jgi:hypothetical protein
MRASTCCAGRATCCARRARRRQAFVIPWLTAALCAAITIFYMLESSFFAGRY